MAATKSLAKLDESDVQKMDETLALQQDALVELKGKTFQTAALTAKAMIALREMFDRPGVMETMVIPLRGSKLGFRTDRDGSGGNNPYSENDLKDPIIEGLLKGARLTGNEINIIAGGAYLTREFFQRILSETVGLDYKVVHGIPRTQPGGCTITSTVTYTYRGSKTETEELELAIKGDKYSTVDAYRGKADRKSRAWLYSRLTGVCVSDADIDDNEAIDIRATVVPPAAPNQPKSHPLEQAKGETADYLEWVKDHDYRKLKKYLSDKGWLMPGQAVDGLDQQYIDLIMADPAGHSYSVNAIDTPTHNSKQ